MGLNAPARLYSTRRKSKSQGNLLARQPIRADGLERWKNRGRHRGLSRRGSATSRILRPECPKNQPGHDYVGVSPGSFSKELHVGCRVSDKEAVLSMPGYIDLERHIMRLMREQTTDLE